MSNKVSTSSGDQQHPHFQEGTASTPSTTASVVQMLVAPTKVFPMVVMYLPRDDAWSLRSVHPWIWRYKTVDIIYTVLCRVYAEETKEKGSGAPFSSPSPSPPTNSVAGGGNHQHFPTSSSFDRSGTMDGLGLEEEENRKAYLKVDEHGVLVENPILRDVFNLPVLETTYSGSSPIRSGPDSKSGAGEERGKGGGGIGQASFLDVTLLSRGASSATRTWSSLGGLSPVASGGAGGGTSVLTMHQLQEAGHQIHGNNDNSNDGVPVVGSEHLPAGTNPKVDPSATVTTPPLIQQPRVQIEGGEAGGDTPAASLARVPSSANEFLMLEYGPERKQKIQLFGRLSRLGDLLANHEHLRCFNVNCNCFPIIGKRFSCLYCGAIFCPRCSGDHVPSHLLIVSDGFEDIDFTQFQRSITVLKHPKCEDCGASADKGVYHVIRKKVIPPQSAPKESEEGMDLNDTSSTNSGYFARGDEYLISKTKENNDDGEDEERRSGEGTTENSSDDKDDSAKGQSKKRNVHASTRIEEVVFDKLLCDPCIAQQPPFEEGVLITSSTPFLSSTRTATTAIDLHGAKEQQESGRSGFERSEDPYYITQEDWGAMSAAPERVYQLQENQILRRTTFCDYCGITIEGEYFKSLGVIDFDVCGPCFKTEEGGLLAPRLKHKAFLHIKYECSFKSFDIKARIQEAVNEAIEYGQKVVVESSGGAFARETSTYDDDGEEIGGGGGTAGTGFEEGRGERVSESSPLSSSSPVRGENESDAAPSPRGMAPEKKITLFDEWELPEHLMITSEHTKTRNPPTGRLFEASDLYTGVTHAVKVARAQRAEVSRRESNEAGQQLRELQHPNIVHYKEAGEIPGVDGGQLRYVVGGWCAGNSVEHIMVHSAKLFLYPSAIRQFSKDMLTGLEFLHGKGLTHGNIHPKNCLQNHNGSTLLSDYELVQRALGHRLKPIENYSFTAPEVLCGGAPTPASDIWSLGAIVMFLMSSRRRWVEYELSSSSSVAGTTGGFGANNNGGGGSSTPSSCIEGFISFLQTLPPEEHVPNIVRKFNAGVYVDAPYNFPRAFTDFLASIFVDAGERPTASQLLEAPIFNMKL